MDHCCMCHPSLAQLQKCGFYKKAPFVPRRELSSICQVSSRPPPPPALPVQHRLVPLVSCCRCDIIAGDRSLTNSLILSKVSSEDNWSSDVCWVTVSPEAKNNLPPCVWTYTGVQGNTCRQFIDDGKTNTSHLWTARGNKL